METFLSPVENPKGLILKLAYYFARRQFGKVLTPLKVHSARLPSAFGLFYAKIGQLDKKLELPPETVLLIREKVARINVCLFCMDIGYAVRHQQEAEIAAVPYDKDGSEPRADAGNRRPNRDVKSSIYREPSINVAIHVLPLTQPLAVNVFSGLTSIVP